MRAHNRFHHRDFDIPLALNWIRNLRKNPEVTVNLCGGVVPARARVVEDSPDQAVLSPHIPSSPRLPLFPFTPFAYDSAPASSALDAALGSTSPLVLIRPRAVRMREAGRLARGGSGPARCVPMNEEILENPVTGDSMRISSRALRRSRPVFAPSPRGDSRRNTPSAQGATNLRPVRRDASPNQREHRIVRAGPNDYHPCGARHFQWNPCDSEAVSSRRSVRPDASTTSQGSIGLARDGRGCDGHPSLVLSAPCSRSSRTRSGRASRVAALDRGAGTICLPSPSRSAVRGTCVGRRPAFLADGRRLRDAHREGESYDLFSCDFATSFVAECGTPAAPLLTTFIGKTTA